MIEVIKTKIRITPMSHRAGCWAMDERYFNLLAKYGYKVDCSVTPHINWKNALGQTKNFGGTDYSKHPRQPYVDKSGVLEVPVTVRNSHKFFMPEEKNMRKFAGSLVRMIKGQQLWLRPNGYNLNQMLEVLDIVKNSDSDYIMFMLHSSEMMAGGSPTFKTKQSIEKMYENLRVIFNVAKKDFIGYTLTEFYNERRQQNES